jgi:hypothetical protein
VHETVGEVTRRYLGLVDEAVAGRVEGLYLVGSVALDDFRPGASDVDFVAVAAEPWGEGDVAALADAHRRLREELREPAFDGVYVTWGQLAADPRPLDAVPHHHEREVTVGGAFDANVVQWATLRAHPVAVRGTDAPTVWADPAALRGWVLGNLNGYWAEWLARQQKLMGRGTMMLADWAVGWGVLGIPRLHYTLATGEVTSKSGAGEYALATFGEEWAPIVTEALRLRRGGEQSEEYRRRPLARRREALAFMAHVLDDANAHYATPPT